MLKKLTVVLTVFFCIFSSYAQEKSDRENSDLKGYVKSIKEETVEIIFKNGKPKERNRELNTIKTFDISGRQKTYYTYTDEGKVLYGDTLIYDANNKLIEKRTEHSEFVYLCDKYTYIYDENGRKAEEICHVNNKGEIGKYINRYDENGRLFEVERIPIIVDKLYFSKHTLKRYKYGEKGELKEVAEFERIGEEWKSINSGFGEHKRLYFSNDQSKTSTSIEFNKDDKLLFVTVSLNDENGNEIETIKYLPDGSIKEANRYEYEYDKQGNYIKETDFEWITEDGKSFFQPSEISYRKIEYFTEKEIKEFDAKTQNSNRPQDNQVLQNTDKEEYAVYNALLEQWIVNEDIKNIVVKKFTDSHSIGDEKTLTLNSFLSPRGENSSLEQSIINNYNEKNYRRSSELLKENFENNSKIALVSDSEAKEIFAEGCNEGWKKLSEKYPNSQGLTKLSRVGFNEDKTKAIVYIGHSFACLGGAGYLVVLQKTSEGWKIINEQMLWIS